MWVLRYREPRQDGTTAHRSIIVGTLDQYPTKAKAQKAAEALRLSLNSDHVPTSTTTFGTLVDRYILEALHTFRHTYRTLLDETGAPMKVQQELMRHANIQTTMNVYGSAMVESKRTANSKIVRMVLVLPIKRENGKGRAPAAP